MTQAESGKVRTFLAEPASAELLRMQRPWLENDDIVQVALMPDAHVADGVCVGSVVASRDGLYPDAVGSDIGCGMLAAKLDGRMSRLRRGNSAELLLEGFTDRIPVHQWPSKQVLPDGVLEKQHPSVGSVLERDGAVQFGTLGRGNHFLELDYADNGELWLIVHSGSRSIGPHVKSHHRTKALDLGPKRGSSQLPGLVAESPSGISYLQACELAIVYAEANRRRLLALALEVIERVLKVTVTDGTTFTCIHNFVRQEPVTEEPLWLHRKGALSARSGEPGIIPGSMGTESYLVTGRGSAAGLYSSSHGAGRVRARGEAFRQITVRKLEREMGTVTYSRNIAKRLVDEAPSNYRPIGAVMRAQSELTRIETRLRPWVVFKGV